MMTGFTCSPAHVSYRCGASKVASSPTHHVEILVSAKNSQGGPATRAATIARSGLDWRYLLGRADPRETRGFAGHRENPVV
jgi:hypothetical protein